MQGRVLIVEDIPLNRFLLAQQVRQEGCQVIEACDGLQALEKLEEEPVDLILLDMHMPRLDGFGVLERLRADERHASIPVIVVSSVDDTEATVRCIELGAADYLLKPIHPALLRARLRTCLEKKQQMNQLLELQEHLQQRNQDLEHLNLELAVLNKRLEDLAFTDALTDLPNRRAGLLSLQQMWAASKRRQQPLSCLMVDVDHFKRVNDTYGHDRGDLVLQAVARSLKASARASDVACRFGGEEFLVLCPDTDVGGAESLGERILTLVKESVPAFMSDPLSVSAGAAQNAPEMRDGEVLVAAADKALYQAKREGRARVCRYQPC